jgi:hypothetical protein
MALRTKIGGLWAAIGATIAAGAASAQTATLRDGLDVIGVAGARRHELPARRHLLAHDIRALDNALCW